jgi:hypothetical protein
MDAEAGTYVGVAALFISALFAWLNKRDTLKHDTELKLLKAAQEQCAKDSAECKEDRAQAKADLVKAKTELAARDAKDKADLQAQIDALKKQVNK